MFVVLEKFLKLNNFSRVISDFEDYYQSHPNFPSLFALTDTFSFLNIENVAARVEKEQYSDLPESFLGYVANDEQRVNIALVNKVNGSVQVTFEGEKAVRHTIEEFKNRWNGIVVAIEPQEKEIVRAKLSTSFSLALFAAAMVGVFFLFNPTEIWSTVFLNYSLYILGAILSITIIREKLNENPSDASKICSIGTNTSCDSVIKSTQANLTKWVDFSDLCILFYGSALISIVINPASSELLNTISLLSLPLIAYSVWIQRVVLKTWCVLCLVISGLLLVQSIGAFVSGVQFAEGWKEVLFASSLMTVLWFFLRKFLAEKSSLGKENMELLRFKREFEIFQFLQQPIRLTTKNVENGKINLGSGESEVSVSIVISPSCGHCHTAFEDALKLYQENPSRLNIEFFYNLNPENGENPYLQIARNTLQVLKDQPEKCIEALSDWHLNKMDKEEWLKKWDTDQIHPSVDSWLKEQYEWCVQNEFNYTPVKIINDRELSKHYKLEELKYFMSELTESEETIQ